MRWRIGIVVAVSALLAHLALVDGATPSMARPSYTYSTVDVIEFLAYARGPIAAAHPQLTTPEPDGSLTPTAAQTRAAAHRVAGCIDAVDNSAGPALADAFNEADPVRLDSALRHLDAAVSRWLHTSVSQGVPCPPAPTPPTAAPSESGSAWLTVTGLVAAWHVAAVANTAALAVTVTAALAINVAGLVAVAAIVAAVAVFVPVFITYQFETTPSAFDRQNAIAKLARALRS